MRIIDKLHDYYDYLQDPTDDIVFDRRGSILLSKEQLALQASSPRYCIRSSKYRFLLMQCGATFWLMLLTVTNRDEYYTVKAFDLELLKSWKNYDKENKLFNIQFIELRNYSGLWERTTKDYDYDSIKKNIDKIIDSINHNDIFIDRSVSNDEHYPLLKASGISNCIDPTELFYAIEEYFSIEKMKKETTEPKGATNEDKIIMHGFDTKTSFRGKH